MLAGPLPAVVDHRKMANQAGIVEGSVPIRQFERLADLLANSHDEVHLKLAFTNGTEGRTRVSGELSTVAEFTCQSCLTPVQMQIACQVQLELVRDEATFAELDQEINSLLVTEDQVALVDLVEDELILAVPMIPRHPDGECPDSDYQIGHEEKIETSEETYRPFANLAEAMNQKSEK